MIELIDLNQAENPEDDPRSGRSNTAVNDANITAEENLLKDDRRITICEVSASVGISTL